MIHESAVIDPGASLGEGVRVGPYAVIGSGVTIGRACEIGAHAVLEGQLELGDESRVFPHAVLGTPPQDIKYSGETSRLVIGKRCLFREGVTVNRGTAGGGGLTRIGDGCVLMANSHVAHDCSLGREVILANSVALAGHVEVEDYAWFGGLAGIHQYGRIGAYAFVGAGAMVRRDVPPFTVVRGDRARIIGINGVGLKRHEFTEERIGSIEIFFGILADLGEDKGLSRLEGMDDPYGDARAILTFYQQSTLGVSLFDMGRWAKKTKRPPAKAGGFGE